MAAKAERAASNMGQQLQDIATIVRSLQKSAERRESRRRHSDSQRDSDSGERTAPQNKRTPQSDPKELECNIKLWKQWEAKASHKHMWALKKKANQVERELGQLYKEQQPQEELNMVVERNRQSRNTLSSYQRMRVAGLSGDTRHKQRDTLGVPQESVPFQREQSMPLTFGQGILDQSELIDPFDSITGMVRVAIEASKGTDPEKSVLAKAGVKVVHPDSYCGGSDLKEFEIFVAGVLRWLRVNSLLRPSNTEIQLQYLGTRLKGEAHEWCMGIWLCHYDIKVMDHLSITFGLFHFCDLQF
jgi:hypothetical protein